MGTRRSGFGGAARLSAALPSTRITAAALPSPALAAVAHPSATIAALFVVLSAVGCSGPAAPPHDGSTVGTSATTVAAPATASAPAAAAPEGSASAAPAEPSASASASAATGAAAPSAAAPEDRRVADACGALCAEVKRKCKPDRAQRCEAQCPTYVAKAKGCETQTVAALGCQAKSSGVCVAIAGGDCEDELTAMQACFRGERPAAAPSGPTLPSGWTLFEDAELRAAVALPSGAAVVAGAKQRTISARVGELEYLFAVQPRPQKTTDGALVAAVVRYVGFTCQKQLQLRGRVDRDGYVGVGFESNCSDGSHWSGMLHVLADRALVTASHGPADAAPVTTPFYDSFAPR